METLQTTPRKSNGLKSYTITYNGLRSCQYSLNLTSKPSENLCGSIVFINCDTFEKAEQLGAAFLESAFSGISAGRTFKNSLKNK